MTADPSDTTSLSYWLNWRFFLCALWILFAMVLASILIWKYEGFKKSGTDRREKKQTGWPSYEDEAWNTCLKGIHPAWLLGYRVISFMSLFALITADVVVSGPHIFYFYTQWTFTLVTIYFGFGSSMSIYGLCKYRKRVGGDKPYLMTSDGEQGAYGPPMLTETADISNISNGSKNHEELHTRSIASVLGFVFQIVFQVCAGAVLLTDVVFWSVLYPFMFPDNFTLSFLIVCMHSANAVFLLGDTILNCMRFPMFRFAYFILWTSIFVIFQWIIHACVSLGWPYQFLDLSSPQAPLWYFAVGLIHIPCYGIFALLVKLKHYLLSRSFQESYQCLT